jgi:radical SAM protein with 4Fe4S-binding SPASM domain
VTRCRQEVVVLELTKQCNNSCLHCYNFWREGRNQTQIKHELSRFQIRKLIQRIRLDTPLRNVALSGGEPLLRRDISQIVGDLYECGLNSVVITNGALLNEKNLRNFPSDTAFEITLFSAHSKIHNQIAGNKIFDQVLENICHIKKRGYKLFFAIVVTRKNISDLRKTIELGIALGAEGFLLNRINLSRYVIPFAHKIVPSIASLYNCLYEADQSVKQYGIPISISVPIPPCLINPGDFPHLHFGWCPRGNKKSYYTIGTTGLLRPCNHSSIILGNLFTQSYAELVNGKIAKKFWSTIPKICSECNHPLKNQCLGGCPAAAYECLGSNEYIDPFVGLAS